MSYIWMENKQNEFQNDGTMWNMMRGDESDQDGKECNIFQHDSMI